MLIGRYLFSLQTYSRSGGPRHKAFKNQLSAVLALVAHATRSFQGGWQARAIYRPRLHFFFARGVHDEVQNLASSAQGNCKVEHWNRQAH